MAGEILSDLMRIQWRFNDDFEWQIDGIWRDLGSQVAVAH